MKDLAPVKTRSPFVTAVALRPPLEPPPTVASTLGLSRFFVKGEGPTEVFTGDLSSLTPHLTPASVELFRTSRGAPPVWTHG